MIERILGFYVRPDGLEKARSEEALDFITRGLFSYISEGTSTERVDGLALCERVLLIEAHHTGQQSG
jgi:hypothetical protein